MPIPADSQALAVLSSSHGLEEPQIHCHAISCSELSPTIRNFPSLSGYCRNHKGKGFLKLREVVDLTDNGKRDWCLPHMVHFE